MTKNQQKAMTDRIKKRRAALGFTQESFSEAIGLSLSSYTKIENAFQKPSLNSIIKIAQKLEVSLDYLVFGEKEDLHKPGNEDKLNAILKSADKHKLLHAVRVISKIAKMVD